MLTQQLITWLRHHVFQVYMTPLRKPGFHIFVLYHNGHVAEGSQNPFNVFLLCVVRLLHGMQTLTHAHAVTCGNQEKGGLGGKQKGKALWTDFVCENCK